MHYRYVIVGGGLTAAAAVEGIRTRDFEGSILMLTRENHLPYHRAPLTKGLWAGASANDCLPARPDAFYEERRVDVLRRRDVVEIDPENHVLWDDRGESYGYEELLLATGSRPKRLHAEGAESQSVRYYHDLEDYLDLRARLERVQHVTLVGGGVTSLELAGSLRALGTELTLIIPDEYPMPRVLPRQLGLGLLERLRRRGVETVSGETLVTVQEGGEYVRARTSNGNDLMTQLVIVDLGSDPQSDLADAAGLDADDGIVVDEYGHASRPNVWAAGDVAEFPYLALGQLMRVESADHAEQHGRAVGANMAGANAPYARLPLQWVEVLDQRIEGIGELNARLDTQVLWTQPGQEGIVYYLSEDVVRGVMLVNVPDRIEWARSLVREQRPHTAAERAALATATR